MVIGIGSKSHIVNLQFRKRKACYRICNHICFVFEIDIDNAMGWAAQVYDTC